MILIIDNYDSFVYNLARYVKCLGFNTYVVRNDKITLQEIYNVNPSHIILSPGPCGPNKSGICLEIVNKLYKIYPILGVCLGHQVIASVFNGQVVKAKIPQHGKSSIIEIINHSILYNKLPLRFTVGRYHSLAIKAANFPKSLKITAITMKDNCIMSIEHNDYPIFGVQFHPESLLTEYGMELINNFLSI